MIDAHAFPGPALWQGIMLCLLPLALYLGVIRKDGEDVVPVFLIYAAIGVALMTAILVYL